MADTAIVRTSRALDLIPYLVEHSGITIQDLAAKFDTTPTEISETLNILFMCGLPGYTHLELIDLSTEDDTVSIIDPQNLNKPRKLSQQEIVSLLLGLDNLHSMGHLASKDIIKSTQEKLIKILENLEILSQVGVVPASSSPWIPQIEEAIKSKKLIKIRYQSIGNDADRFRSISPRRIYSGSGNLYVEALNEQGFIRHFRIDRIIALEFSDKMYIKDINQEELTDIEVEIVIPKKELRFLESIEDMVISSEIFDDFRRIFLRTSNLRWLVRALSAIPGHVDVVSPKELQQEFVEFARKSLKNYQ